MKISCALLVIIVIIAVNASAQTLSNDTLKERIWNAKSDKSITLTYDPAAKTSKLIGVSENFAKSEASRAGILAMNFAIGFFYPGDALEKAPETFHLAFWVMSRKPRFTENHSMTAALREEMLVIGSARYASKPREQMEYLNFDISRENLAKVAAESNVRFKLGDEEFTFTKSQMKLLADVLTITEK